MLELSPLETKRFGFVCARLNIVPDKEFNLRDVNAFASRNNVQLLTSRVPVELSRPIHLMEEDGHRLMDTLVYYQRSAFEPAVMPIVPDGFTLRMATAADAKMIGEVARHSFSSYLSHYHNDVRLDPQSVNDGYVEWAERTALDISASKPVIVISGQAGVVAFMSLDYQSNGETDIRLTATLPRFQGKGLFTVLLYSAFHLVTARGVTRIIISTQINNYRAQKIWTAHGLSHFKTCHTFHKWFS